MWDQMEVMSGNRMGPPDEGDIQASIAISLKRIADTMEQRNKIESYSPADIENDPLMIIARAIEEIARPTLSQNSPMLEIAERECKALETIATRLDHLTDYFNESEAQLRIAAQCDVRV